MKRLIGVLCAIFTMATILATPAFADPVEPRASAFFISYDSFIDVISPTEFEVWFDVVGAGTMEEIGVNSIEIQRSDDGQNWTTVQTCLPEDNPSMIHENTFFAYDSVTCYVFSGYYYRAYVSFYAKNSSGFGETYQYSEMVYLMTLK